MKSKKAAAAFCGSCFFAGKPQRFKLQFAEDLAVEETAERGIIKEKNTTKGIGIQYFANKGLDKQSDRELQKSIRSWNVIVEKHKDKVNNPAKYDKDWGMKKENQKAGLVKHWEKEIRTAEKCIKEANELLAKRKGEEK